MNRFLMKQTASLGLMVLGGSLVLSSAPVTPLCVEASSLTLLSLEDSACKAKESYEQAKQTESSSKGQMDTANTALLKARSDLKKGTDQVTSSKNSLSKAQKTYDQAVADTKGSGYASATAALSSAKEKQKQAEGDVNRYTQMVSENQVKVSATKEAVSSLKESLSKKEDTLHGHEERVSSLKNEISSNTDTLSFKENQLSLFQGELPTLIKQEGMLRLPFLVPLLLMNLPRIHSNKT